MIIIGQIDSSSVILAKVSFQEFSFTVVKSSAWFENGFTSIKSSALILIGQKFSHCIL